MDLVPGCEVDCLWEAGALLGEGPVWDEREQALYWVDIEGPTIHRYSGGRRDEWPMPAKIGCIALRSGGGFVAGLQTGFVFVDLDGPTVEAVIDPEPELPGNRFNDGKVDGAGRFWAGTMDDSQVRPSGALYCLDPGGRVQRKDDGYVVTNGPAWSPDGTTMYHNDSHKRIVYAFDCDPATGEIDGKRVFLELGAGDGFPDGLTVDSDGGIWLAHWGGWRVTRFTPDGQVDRLIKLPAAQVTSCAFGGDGFHTLYITTARTGLDAAALADQPLAGGLFAIETDATGLPANRYGG